MSVFGRLFNRAYRRAKRQEAAGELREAAMAYAEADMTGDAVRMLLAAGARAMETPERVAAFRDALQLMPTDDPKRGEVEIKIGLALVEEGQAHGARTLAERRTLKEAADLLEKNEQWAEAATAFELLRRPEDVARCLEAGGEIDRLEALLDKRSARSDKARTVRDNIKGYEMALATGARLEACDALREAAKAAPEDRTVVDLLNRLQERLPGHAGAPVLMVRAAGLNYAFVGRSRITLGREGDVPLRGSSLSREHVAVELLPDGELQLEDLGSRNGTLVRGLPIGGPMKVQGATELGLGDDVTIAVERDKDTLHLHVTKGLDRGLRIVAGLGGLRARGTDGERVAFWVGFDGPHGRLTSAGHNTLLNGEPVVAPIICLTDDLIEVDGHRVEIG